MLGDGLTGLSGHQNGCALPGSVLVGDAALTPVRRTAERGAWKCSAAVVGVRVPVRAGLWYLGCVWVSNAKLCMRTMMPAPFRRSLSLNGKRKSVRDPRAFTQVPRSSQDGPTGWYPSTCTFTYRTMPQARRQLAGCDTRQKLATSGTRIPCLHERTVSNGPATEKDRNSLPPTPSLPTALGGMPSAHRAAKLSGRRCVFFCSL